MNLENTSLRMVTITRSCKTDIAFEISKSWIDQSTETANQGGEPENCPWVGGDPVQFEKLFQERDLLWDTVMSVLQWSFCQILYSESTVKRKSCTSENVVCIGQWILTSNDPSCKYLQAVCCKGKALSEWRLWWGFLRKRQFSEEVAAIQWTAGVSKVNFSALLDKTWPLITCFFFHYLREVSHYVRDRRSFQIQQHPQ